MSKKSPRWDKGLDLPLPSGSADIVKEEDFGFQQRNVKERHRRFADEMKKHAVGPVPMDKFLNRVLPNPPPKQKRKKRASKLTMRKGTKRVVDDFACVPEEADRHEELLQPLCEALRPFFTNHTLVDTHLHTEFGSVRALKPDLCLYSNEIVDQLRVKGNQYIANFGYMGVVFEVKKSSEYDPFHDPDRKSGPGHVFIRNDPDRKEAINKALGQIGAYAAAVCARQYRTHCFTVSIYGPSARIIRWDRAGAIVSRAFNYHKQPHWLREFARRYSQASDAQRGYDMTVVRAHEEEEKMFADVVRKHVKDQLRSGSEEELEKFVKEHYVKDRVYKISVIPQQQPERAIPGECIHVHLTTDEAPPAIDAINVLEEKTRDEEGATSTSDSGTSTLLEDTCRSVGAVANEGSMTQVPSSISRKYTEVQYFLVSRPVIAPTRTTTGRSTRGYWAVKLPDESLGETEHTIAFLKDTWRTSVPGSEKEGDIMVELIEDGVENISDIFCHGDLTECSDAYYAKYQATETDRLKKESWNCNKDWKNRIFAHNHYRVAFTEVGYPLSYLLGTKELIHATHTAFKAALQALEKSKRLHRDISIDNIILVRKGDNIRIGILIDWELSCKSDRNGTARQYSRTGTWAFMSINVLRGREDYRHTFYDDMESFFYAVLYAAIRWLPHPPVEHLGDLMSDYFNEYREVEGVPKGGRAKLSNLWGKGDDFANRFKWENEHLARWIGEAFTLQHRETFEGPKGMFWTPENLTELWNSADMPDLPENDRVEHKIMLGSEEIKKPEFQATSASVLSGPSSENYVSSARLASAIASGSLVSLGKRSATDMEMEEGSEQSGMSRESKRKRPAELVEVEGSGQQAGSSTGRRVILRFEKRRERRAKR